MRFRRLIKKLVERGARFGNGNGSHAGSVRESGRLVKLRGDGSARDLKPEA